MNFKIAINIFRKKLLQAITKVVIWDNGKSTFLKDPVKVNHILICRPNNRLGNQILISPLIQELTDIFPNSKIDLFVRGKLSALLFENYENISNIIKLPDRPFKNLIRYIGVWFHLRRYRYDLVINATESSSSGRLATRFARSRTRLFCYDKSLSNKYPDSLHVAKAPIYCLRDYLANSGIDRNKKPIPRPDIKLSLSEISKGKEILANIVGSAKETICIYTYATGDKCYSKSWWKTFYELLKTTYGERYHILEVLPKKNVSQIDFAESAFYSLDLREIGGLIANTRIFIGADSGMMHLASAVNVPTVGLFSVTDPAGYGPYNKNSTAINTTHISFEEILKVVDAILRKTDE
ncbi:MAG: glycosyltransferase family 9 protein [Flavobacteriaceae bacterium]|jgi:ADP-heptose:LPS heptosyltransferase|nr:glycosyltransferase family 9 protein [Flavobacteriaceae bacterium]